MTLIEVMIVLLIVASLVVAAVGLFNNISKANLKGQALRLSGYVKYAYGQSAIQQQYYRLVIDINTNEYWVEVAKAQDVGAPTPPPEPELLTELPSGVTGGANTFGGGQAQQGYAEGDTEAGAFGLKRPKYEAAQERLAKRRELQGGVKFVSVTKSYDEGPIEVGRAFITFYPSGFVDRSQIVIQDENGAAMTLELQPLTGKVDLFVGEREADRDFFEVEEDE
jgi:type II secretory pathway pseudopilin PulG